MATLSDVIRKQGLFKQPSPEHRASVSRARRRVGRARTPLSPEEQCLIEAWWHERRALLERARTLPTKPEIARHLGVARLTLDRILTQIRRCSSGKAVAGSPRVQKLARVHAQTLTAWQSARDHLQKDFTRVPGLRVFAHRQRIAVALVSRCVRSLQARAVEPARPIESLQSVTSDVRPS